MLRRLFRHLWGEDWAVRRAFPRSALERIAAVIEQEERRHSGELRFVIEGGLDPWRVLRGQTPRERAVELFAELGVWDTEQNNGVLIFVLLADRDVEIVADRGIAARVPAAEWEAICQDMERRFAGGHYEDGAVTGLREVSDLLAAHFPPRDSTANELPDRPLVL